MAEENKGQIKNNIVSLGFVSFFSGLGQDMINSVFPIFLSSLGFNKEFVGLVNGLVASVSSLLQVLSGYLSDKLRHRKWIVFIGYVFSGVARPLLALVGTAAPIIGLRFADAVGKGAKQAPADSLVAESSPENKTGRSFGLQRLLDTMGSVIGPLLAALMLAFFGSGSASYRKIFLLAAIPGFIALLIILFFVRETGRLKIERGAAKSKSTIFSLPKDFYFLLLAIMIFSLGNSTDAFLILRAQNLGLSLAMIPIVYAAYYLVYALLSYPIGILSDRFGKRIMIVGGWCFYALTYLGFAAAASAWQVWPLFVLYGIFYAATDGSGRALTADVVPAEHHGLAFGLYNTAIAVIALPASIIAGWLWDRHSPAAAFNFGALMSVLAIIFFAGYSIQRAKNKKLWIK